MKALISIVLVIIILGGGWYYYKNNSNNDLTNNNQINMENLSPSQVYINWRTELSQASNFEDVYKIQMKYSNADAVKNLKEHEQEAYAQSEQNKAITLDRLKNKKPSLNEITIVKETVNSNKATLQLSTTNKDYKGGEAELLNESGAWRVYGEVFWPSDEKLAQ